MILNDLSGKEEEESSFVEDEELEGSISATDLFSAMISFDVCSWSLYDRF